MKTKNKINESTAQTHSRNNGTHHTHFTHLVTFPKAAFTLAEVLITLAIIGVVALTIPSLIAKYEKKITVSKMQKDIAVLEQALRMSEAENGEIATWTLPDETFAGNTKFFAEKYFLPYLKTLKTSIPASEDCWANTKSISGQESDNYKIGATTGAGTASACATLTNGSNIYFWANNPINARPHAQIWVDINGKKAPNMLGKDVFGFYAKFSEGTLKPSGFGLTRDELKSASTESGCNKDNPSVNAGQHCSGLIATDGWVISDDYPW